MQVCTIGLAILLAGQLGDGSGTRYPSVVPPTQPGNESTTVTQTPAGQPPQVEQPASTPAGNPLRSQSQPATPPVNSTPPRNTAPPARTSTPPASTTPANRLTKIEKPAKLLENLVKPKSDRALRGTPLTLADAVASSRSRQQQSQRVAMYWDLSHRVADYYLTVREELDLQAQRSGLLQPGQAWTSAQQAAAARKNIALNSVRAAQLRLQKALGRPTDASLPLPTDLPHCGTYKTKYEKIFQGRTSREAEQLAQLLPLRHQALRHQAAHMAEALQWYNRVNQQRSAQSDATLLLKAYEQLAMHRRAFVAAAYTYNDDIARYTDLAVPQDVGSIRLVSMLIKSDSLAGGNWQSGGIQRASAEESAGQSNVADRYPRTFAEGGRNETRRVPAKDADDEQSILVDPKSEDEAE